MNWNARAAAARESFSDGRWPELSPVRRIEMLIRDLIGL
jgi:hypothetical protein